MSVTALGAHYFFNCRHQIQGAKKQDGGGSVKGFVRKADASNFSVKSKCPIIPLTLPLAGETKSEEWNECQGNELTRLERIF